MKNIIDLNNYRNIFSHPFVVLLSKISLPSRLLISMLKLLRKKLQYEFRQYKFPNKSNKESFLELSIEYKNTFFQPNKGIVLVAHNITAWNICCHCFRLWSLNIISCHCISITT